ncbi:MAG: glycosyltransferase family 4 protein [Pseudomonadota bacterium]
MNILYHSWEFGPGAGGIGQYLYQMAKGLSELGHKCIIVTGRDQAVTFSQDEVVGEIYRIYTRSEVGSAKVAANVLELAKKHFVDIIEGTDHWGECQRILRSSNRPKVLIKLHSCQYLKKLEEASMFYWWQKYFIKIAQLRIRSQICAEKYCVENADAIIAPSRKIFIEYKKQGARLPPKSALIPNILHEIPEIESGYVKKNPVMLFVGRLEILKGIEYLPEILGKVVRKVPDVILEIAGDDQYARGIGSLKEWLTKRFGSLITSVRFLGKLNAVQMSDAYRRSSLLVFPSKWDNFPMAVLEAMSYGKPVVTTCNGGMPEMLAGTGGVLADPESEEFSQAIVTLLSNEKLLYDIGNACRRKVVEHYTPNKVMPGYLKFVESCL